MNQCLSDCNFVYGLITTNICFICHLLPNGDFNVITNLFYEPSLSWMKDIRLGTKELLLVYTKEQILIFIAYFFWNRICNYLIWQKDEAKNLTFIIWKRHLSSLKIYLRKSRHIAVAEVGHPTLGQVTYTNDQKLIIHSYSRR
jgi:hypothetical protein